MFSESFVSDIVFMCVFLYRKASSLQRMGFQDHPFQMDGREKMGFMQLVLQEEGSPVRRLMPSKWRKTSVRFGIKKSSRRAMPSELPAIEDASLSLLMI